MEKSLADEIVELPEVENVFGNAMCYDVAAEINGNAGSVGLISYDGYMFAWSKNSVISGDLSKIT